MNRKAIRIVVPLLLLGAAAAWWLDLPARLAWTHGTGESLTLYGNVDIRQVQSATVHIDLTAFSKLLSQLRPAAGREVAREINDILFA